MRCTVAFFLVVAIAGLHASDEFQWEWRKAVYPRNHLRALTHRKRDKQALQNAIAGQLRADLNGLNITSESELQSVVLESSVTFIDLDRDGTNEVIAMGRGSKAGCGATGNCPIWVFKRNRRSYKLLLTTHGQGFTVSDRRTAGYANIFAPSHMSAFEQEVYLYRFSGNVYREAGCRDYTWWTPHEGDLKKPIITICK
jgi:hypothetical protein